MFASSETTTARLVTAVVGSSILFAWGFLAGCTEASIAQGARRQIAEANYAYAHRDYATAHQYFAGAAKKISALSPRERREAMDGLCRTEYEIGTPSYPLTQQLRTCTAALDEPDSESGLIYGEVVRKERAAVAETINAALAQRDIAAADDAILRYRALPGSNPEAALHWTRQAWNIVDRETVATPNKVALELTIAQLSHSFPNLQKMSDRQFRRWIVKQMTIADTTIVSNIEIGKGVVGLWLGNDQLENAALNLDRFEQVNNGLAVRCHCNARTNVALTESGLPAYLVRLDTANRRSEVLILHQP